MSGGERKKRGDKGQGWEEAGAEFYQERYPMAIEAADPSLIATLLPSKKSRVATMTAKRMRQEVRMTLRRRTSTRTRTYQRTYSNTARRMSMNIHDAAVSMLPDLSENLSNEESTWEEIMQIKAMPVCMAQKLQLKKQLQSATKLRLQGFEQLKWQHRKFLRQCRIKLKELYSKTELWSGSLKTIGANLGTGVAYFLFIKWLFFLNILIFLVVFLSLVLPTIVLKLPEREFANLTDANDTYLQEAYINVSETHWNNDIMDFLQGRGFLERTLLFYGAYSHEKLYSSFKDFCYNMPLAYALAMIGILGFSFLAILRSAARGFRERIAESEGQFYQYCNLVFSGWDSFINNEKAAATKHRALYNELKLYLESEKLLEEHQNRTREEKLKFYSIRFLVNLLVLSALGCYAIILSHLIDFSFERITSENSTRIEGPEYISFCTLGQAFFEFLPYVFIVVFNTLLPFLFCYLVGLERYSPSFVAKVTLFRSAKLRFVSIVVLLMALYNKVVPEENRPVCWETFVGQQFFKFYLTDFSLQLYVTFFVNFPRSLIAHNAENKVLKFVGEQTFDMPRHVLDIAYSQTICWLGCFFAPLLPLVAAIGFFFLFYIKKFACLVNSKPVNKVYHASRSKSLFMLMLLVSYFLAAIPIVYSVARIEPSNTCGPFRGLDTVWTLLVVTYQRVPTSLRTLVEFSCTSSFAVPTFVVLILALYYYRTVYMANKKMVEVLKNQLVLEGHDKQFLLNRLSAFIKQQQDQTKCHSEGNDLGIFA